MQRPRILIVEDETIVARDISQQLIELGYEPVGTCTRGEEAVTEAERLRPELVLMDIQLAGAMDGIAAARQIRERLVLPVVFLTAFAEGETINRAKLTEPYGYIIKPFDERELRTVIEIALFKHGAESKLRESEERFRSLIDTSMDAVLLTQPDGVVLTANPAACAMFRLSKAELLRRGRRGLVDETDPRLPRALTERMNSGRFRGEITMVRGDGEKFPADISSVVFRTPEGEERVSLVIRDVSERHRMEEAVRQSEERYRMLFDDNPLPIFVYEVSGLKILAVNNAALLQYDYTHEEFLGLTLSRLLPQEDEAVLLRELEQDASQIKKHSEGRHRRKDGTLISVEIAARPLLFAGRNARLVLAADITEKKQMQEQYLRAQRLESLGTLASGIAHDLNNMLAPILFAGPLLRPSLSTARDLRIIDTVEKSAERGSSLVRQILAFAQGTTSAPRITQLKHIARDVLAIIEVTFPKNIRLEQHIVSNAWPVLANPTQIHQVLLNLCVNARDAMPHGGTLTVSVVNRSLDVDAAAGIPGARVGDWLVIDVTDTGTGIAPDALPRIWDSFYTTKPAGKGTGLGLPTVRSIVQGHAGFVQLETALGRGSSFRVFLPADREGEIRAASASPFQESAGRQEIILVVDDDISVREIVSAVLSQGGYRVVECADGVEAIVNYNIKSRDIALVITDVDMPNLGGAILASTLLKLNPALKIIAMSGHTGSAVSRDEVAEVRGMVAAFMQKPFVAGELLATVHRVLHANPQP